MTQKGFTLQVRKIGSTAALSQSFLGVVYIIVTGLGLLSLKSPQDPIGDPYFTVMELLIILMAPLLVISMAAVHVCSRPRVKLYSLLALIFMALLAGITSCVHFVILTVSRQIEAAGLTGAPLLFSFKWPSMMYTLDILAWDWFFALSMLFGAFVFRENRPEKLLRTLMLTAAVLSLAGLAGVPLANMQIRNIGIIGYGVFAPVVFLMLGIIFIRKPYSPDENVENPGSDRTEI